MTGRRGFSVHAGDQTGGLWRRPEQHRGFNNLASSALTVVSGMQATARTAAVPLPALRRSALARAAYTPTLPRPLISHSTSAIGG
jgi:hypothetical protein